MALSDNLIVYYPLDEASGNALDAHSVGPHHLADNNTVGIAAGKVGGARDFEADSGEYFSHADHADFSVADQDFTLAFWIKFESLGTTRGIIHKGTFDNAATIEYGVAYTVTQDRFRWAVADGSNVGVVDANVLGAPATGTWYFVVCWHDSAANQIGIAVNAGTADTASYSTGSHDGAASFTVGADNSGGRFMDGLIDEVGFWKRVLTGGERAELYNAGSGRAYEDFAGGGPAPDEYPRWALDTLRRRKKMNRQRASA